MVVVPSSDALRYHNCCRDGLTSPECFGYNFVYSTKITKTNTYIFIYPEIYGKMGWEISMASERYYFM
jgi:hypothetical protein